MESERVKRNLRLGACVIADLSYPASPKWLRRTIARELASQAQRPAHGRDAKAQTGEWRYA